MAPIQRILIIRLSALGDIFMSSAVLPVLHQAYPGVKIDWLVEPGGADILNGHPHLNEVIALPRKAWTKDFKTGHWLRLEKSLRSFICHHRRESYDLVLDLQGLLKSGIWALLARGKRKIGLRAKEGSQWIHDLSVYPEPGEIPAMGSEYFGMMESLDLDPGEFPLDLWIRPEARASIRKTLPAWFQDDVSPVVLCPFTTRPQKHWFEASWSSLISEFRSKWNRPVIILGGPGDLEAATRIGHAFRSDDQVVLFAGEKRSIHDALAVLERAFLVVGVDTGLTHAAIGLNRPTIGLFGSTRPYLNPRIPKARILYEKLDCSPCYRSPTCEGRFDCMRAHRVSDVFAVGESLLR